MALIASGRFQLWPASKLVLCLTEGKPLYLLVERQGGLRIGPEALLLIKERELGNTELYFY